MFIGGWYSQSDTRFWLLLEKCSAGNRSRLVQFLRQICRTEMKIVTFREKNKSDTGLIFKKENYRQRVHKIENTQGDNDLFTQFVLWLYTVHHQQLIMEVSVKSRPKKILVP